VQPHLKKPLAIANILEPSDVLEALYNTTRSSAKKRTITGKDLIEVLKKYQPGFHAMTPNCHHSGRCRIISRICVSFS
jgi:hypothetical protein